MKEHKMNEQLDEAAVNSSHTFQVGDVVHVHYHDIGGKFHWGKTNVDKASSAYVHAPHPVHGNMIKFHQGVDGKGGVEVGTFLGSRAGGYKITKSVKEEVESLDELSMATVKSYKAKVATNPAPSKTTSDILHKAIRRFAGKERAEDRIHHDEMVKMRSRLGIKEETLEEGNFADSLKDRAKTLVKKLTAPVKDPILDQMKEIGDKVAARTEKGMSAYKQGAQDAYNNKESNNPHPFDPKKGIDHNYDHNSYKSGYKVGQAHGKRVTEEVLDEDAAQKNMSNAMDNIEPGKRDAARKQYTAARKAGQTHAASMTLMHDRFGKTNEETIVETITPSHKVGDTVWATLPTNKAVTMTGKVTKIGRTLTTVKHKDGSEAHYPHELVDNDYEVLHPNPYKKLQREHLEQTGELLTLTEVKYMVENANGGVGAIAQHAGVDGQAPQNTGKAKKMMGNKASIDAIVKIISKGATPN